MRKLIKLLTIGVLFVSIVGCSRNEIDPKYPKCDPNGDSTETMNRMEIECRGIDLEPFLQSIENNASLKLRTIDLDTLFQLIVEEKSFVLVLYHTDSESTRFMWERYYYFLASNADLVIRENILIMHWDEIHNNDIPTHSIGGPFIWFDSRIGAVATVSYINGVFINFLNGELNERDFERLRDPNLPVFVGNDEMFIIAPEELVFTIEELLSVQHLNINEAFGIAYGGGILVYNYYFYLLGRESWTSSNADRTTINMIFPFQYLDSIISNSPYVFDIAVVNHSTDDFETYLRYLFGFASLDDIVGDIVVHTIKVIITE